MTEIWKKSIDEVEIFEVLLKDFTRTPSCLLHELIIAKLNDYPFSLSVPTLMHKYLSYRKQRTKRTFSYSLWEDISCYGNQHSNLGPLLFNIFDCHLTSFPPTSLSSNQKDYELNKSLQVYNPCQNFRFNLYS